MLALLLVVCQVCPSLRVVPQDAPKHKTLTVPNDCEPILRLLGSLSPCAVALAAKVH